MAASIKNIQHTLHLSTADERHGVIGLKPFLFDRFGADKTWINAIEIDNVDDAPFKGGAAGMSLTDSQVKPPDRIGTESAPSAYSNV